MQRAQAVVPAASLIMIVTTSLLVGLLKKIFGIEVAGKLAATTASYGFGGIGGIFAPSLFLGGTSGYPQASFRHRLAYGAARLLHVSAVAVAAAGGAGSSGAPAGRG